MRNHSFTRTFETLSPFDALSSIVMSSDFHFNFLKSFSKVNGVEIVCDWFLDDTQTRLVRKTKVHVFNNQYCALLEEQLIFNDEFEFEKENSCHNTEIEMMRIVFTISILEKESKPFPGTLSISGMFLFNQEKNFKWIQNNNNFDLNDMNKIEENYFVNENPLTQVSSQKATTITSSSTSTASSDTRIHTTPSESTASNRASSHSSSSNENVTTRVMTSRVDTDSSTSQNHHDHSTVRFGTNEIITIIENDPVTSSSSQPLPPLSSHHDSLCVNTVTTTNALNSQHLPIQTNVSVTISIQLDYKVMIIGNVNSVEEKLCKQCAKLFDLWFTQVLQVENSLKSSPSSSSPHSRKSQPNSSNSSHTISTSKPSRSLHKTMMTSSFFTLRSRSVFREHNKRRSLPMRPPPMLVNQQMLQEWINDPNNNVWENPLDPNTDYLETIPHKYIQKHDLWELNQEVELHDMIFDFLHVSKVSKTHGNEEKDNKNIEPHQDVVDPARQQHDYSKKGEKEAQSCTCCCCLC